ncbi:hypothetical protein B0H15DRAFT_885339 [Mycena belliarum]|uniref:F-box domain-containing protein n=1 Tax=Mycena belliarum TaxID=1033014 RepID=A0AAD6U8V7_9AGAR|nr:hypothetical protein B0H15DRAFT_885339 [Mycena belliae]
MANAALSLPSPLPPELFDIIIAQVQDDIHALAACGLVCRSWLVSSRYHIFKTTPVSLRPGNAQQFIELVNHPSSTFCTHVRSLELLSSHVPGGSFDAQWLDPIIGTLARLPCVTDMFIANIQWGNMNPRTKSALLDGFPALTHLELWSTHFDSVSHLVQLICSKPLLHILGLDDLAWEDPSFETSACRVPYGLHSLRLSNCYKRDILDWLVSHEALPPIHHVQLGAVHPEDTHSIGRFLARLGPDLFTLQLEFSSLDAGGDAEDFCARVDLAQNPALHTVILDKFIYYSDYQFSSAVAWIPELVSPIPNLKELSFGIAIRDIGELHPEENPIDWAALDDLFCDPQLAGLRALRFWVAVKYRAEDRGMSGIPEHRNTGRTGRTGSDRKDGEIHGGSQHHREAG